MGKVLCLDLEMNQPSNKTIEVGYVIGDLITGDVSIKRSLIVNPNEPLGFIENNGNKIHISDYTGITQALIDEEGMTLQKAYETLIADVEKFKPTVTCVQWGDGKDDNKGDHDHLRRELGLSWNDFVFRARAWDVKSQFQIYRAFNNKGVISGVVKAMDELGMAFEGRAHCAMDDAWNTFRIFREIGLKAVKYDKLAKIVEGK